MAVSKLEIEPESASRLENGVFAPSLERLANFASLFNCPITTFFHDETEDFNFLVLTLAYIIKPLNKINHTLTINFISELVYFIDQLAN
jgi:transcriptional regulator with XRE-family HTH domain